MDTEQEITVWAREGKTHAQYVISDKNTGRILVRRDLGEPKTIIKIHIPDGATVSHIDIAHTKEIFVKKYAKLPEMCVESRGERRCNMFLRDTDWMSLTSKSLENAFKLIQKVKPEIIQTMRSIVNKIIISRDMPLDIRGSAELLPDGTCNIKIAEHILLDEPERIMKTIAHETAHCIEHYARTKKGKPPAKGGWIEGKPTGREERAEKFAKRLKILAKILEKK